MSQPRGDGRRPDRRFPAIRDRVEGHVQDVFDGADVAVTDAGPAPGLLQVTINGQAMLVTADGRYIAQIVPLNKELFQARWNRPHPVPHHGRAGSLVLQGEEGQ